MKKKKEKLTLSGIQAKNDDTMTMVRDCILFNASVVFSYSEKFNAFCL